jgi:hypothetical protein
VERPSCVGCGLPRRGHDLRDPFHRVSVVLHGDALAIEYRDGQSYRLELTPGQVDWDEPGEGVHRGVNVGEQNYEEVTVFFLDRPDAVPQPTEDDLES